MLVEQTELGDCEAGDEWSFAQDVNAWSSLGYVAAGLVVVVAVGRRRVPCVFVGLGAATALEGVGSVLYHGRPSDASQLLHDAALVGILGFMSGWHVGRLVRGRADGGAFVGLSIGTIAGVVGASSSKVATNSSAAVAAIVLVGAELLARRRHLPAVWNAASILLVGVGLLAWALGTSDSPLCDGDSWAQPHGLWHLLSAITVVVWVDRAASAALPDSHDHADWHRRT